MSVQVHFINPNSVEDMKKMAAELLIAAAIKKISTSSQS